MEYILLAEITDSAPLAYSSVTPMLALSFCHFFPLSLFLLNYLKANCRPWPGSSVGGSVFLICQGCRFDPQSGYI